MVYNLEPERVRHSWVNMYRPPHGKLLPAGYRPRGPFNEFQKDIDLLFDTFLENYNYYKAGQMPLSLEKQYKNFGIPGPSQYEAFKNLISIFANEEFEFLDKTNFYYYDFTQKMILSEIGMVEFIEKLANFDFANQEKKVVLCCGSFWGRCPEIRENALTLLESLYKDKGIKIHIYTNCKEEEIKVHDEFIKQIKGTSRFGLKERIPIHFIQAGNDYFIIEFPHAERIMVRLNLFLDIKMIACKENYKKADVEQFFNNLIQQALV